MAKLTRELTKEICDLLDKGNFVNAVCGYVGISEPTFYGWYNKGKEAGKGQYHEFYMAIETAKARAHVEMVGAIYERAKAGDMRAAIFFLSRRYPNEWSDKREVAIETAIDTDGLRAKLSARVAIEAAETMAMFEPIIDVSTLNDDQLAKYEIFLNSLNEGAVIVLPTNGRG